MEESDLELLNDIRKRFVANIDSVMAVLKSRSKTVEEVTKSLHDYFVENEIQQKGLLLMY